jgi:hypothetical protein
MLIVTLLVGGRPVFAQIERQELPVLQGESLPPPAYSPPQQPGYATPQPSYPPQTAYPPQQPTYPPQPPAYRPQQPAYAPEQPAYAPEPPAYAPEPPGYQPQQPASGLEQPAYVPQEPVYAPERRAYAPQQPGFAPEQRAYAPQQSGYAPEQRAYAPQQPGFAPEQRAYAPERSAHSQPGAERPLPSDLWRGVPAAELETLITQARWPSPSPALTRLIARALATNAGGDGVEVKAKVGALMRAGRVEELIAVLGGAGAPNEPGAAAVYAVALLAAGRDDEACALGLGGAAAGAWRDSLAKRAIFLIPAYCAARGGDRGGAQLALNLARDSGVDTGLAAAALAGAKPPLPRSVDVVDYLFLKLGHAATGADIAARATPDLLYLIARDRSAAPELRVAAAERAAAVNIIGGRALAAAYSDAAPRLPKSVQSPPALRAKLFATLNGQASPKIQAESIDALLASGRDARIEIPMGQALAQVTGGFVQDAPGAGFAETGVRVAALAGDAEAAWQWTEGADPRLRSWQLLLATSDPYGQNVRGALDAGVDIALQSGLPGALLQRLVTVLDALGEEVPIPLWDLAGKTPQPADGYLPETGALTDLKQAADSGDVGRTILLVAAVLGPDGPQGAHLIGLGDSLRALRRVGLDAEARRIGFEALYAHWPQHGKA